MRILVDQSGYDLLNVGDVAMLQACVTRLRAHWPGAEIMVIAHDAERLASYCPGTVPIGRTLADRPVFRAVPRKPRLIAEQVWKIIAPYGAGRLGVRRRSWAVRPDRPRTAIQAVRAADLVVASGGGYVTDTWWWHAAGVLSLLALAQRLGKPTAMFGQGIGPIGRPGLRAQARAVLPGLAVLGLREAQIGRDLAISLGTTPEAITVTGDDAMELSAGAQVASGDALGVNLRVSGYAGVDPAAAKAVGTLLRDIAAGLRAPVIALPVSRYAADSDLDAIRALLGDGSGDGESVSDAGGQGQEEGQGGVALNDLVSPAALAAAAASCRAIVTGSYHAAVFALAQGVPAVCLTKSPYYDAKFDGLRALFPGACFIESLAAPDVAGRLRAAVDQAWDLPRPEREAARDAATRQRDAGRAAYARLRVQAGLDPVLATVGGAGPLA